MATTNTFTKRRHESVVADAVDTNADGDVDVTVDGLVSIDSTADAEATAMGGYVANVQAVDGNTVTVRVYEDAGAAGALSAVTDSADVTDLHVRAVGQ